MEHMMDLLQTELQDNTNMDNALKGMASSFEDQSHDLRDSIRFFHEELFASHKNSVQSFLQLDTFGDSY